MLKVSVIAQPDAIVLLSEGDEVNRMKTSISLTIQDAKELGDQLLEASEAASKMVIPARH